MRQTTKKIHNCKHHQEEKATAVWTYLQNKWHASATLGTTDSIW